jgi:LDH2 family malate/lactate/ureidoglycolate dehydrogenase
LGDLVSNKNFSIPARSNQIIGLDAAVSVFGALGTIINFVKKRQPIPVNVTGQITSDLGILDVNYNTTVL